MPGSRKKLWEIVKASKRPLEGIAGSGRELRFGKQGAMTVSDPGLAHEINQKYGNTRTGTGEVFVIETDDRPKEAGHRYLFSMPQMPWKQEQEEVPQETQEKYEEVDHAVHAE